MNSEYSRKTIEIAYDMINDKPTDRLDCINKTLQLQRVLHTGMAFLNEVALSPYIDDFTEEDLEFLHESFCVSAIPLVQMIEHFLEKALAQADGNPFVV